jgi:ABC-type branched-subunit amino acid transport system ATPase component/branched-subunit amino acid ABC-type transport system permease component
MEILRFMLLGVGTGGVYAMLAQGLVLVYRGSGLLNFSQGAIAMVGAFAYYECTSEHGLPLALGVVIALVICGILGAAIHLLVLRQMQRSSALTRVIATLGITIALQAGAYLRYGHDPHPVKSIIPLTTVHVFSNQLGVGVNVLAIFGIGLALTIVLSIVYKRTAFGRITTAVAEKQRVAATLGHSPDLVASVNWALGAVIAGFGGILIAPILFLEPTQLVLLVLPAMSAALLGGFSSFSITFAMAVLLGVAQSLVGRYVHQVGWASAAPFIVVVIVLIVRGQVIPLRSHVLDRLPTVGSGRIRWGLVLVLYALGTYFTITANLDWALAMITTLSLAVICVSIVVVTGYAGQLSLAQTVIAGVGALVAAKCAGDVPFLVSLLVGAAGGMAAGFLVGIPALRTRGVTLAIATLGLGSALISVVLSNTHYTNGQGGTPVTNQKIFGWSIDPLFQSNRYAFVTFTVLVLICIGVANLRRGATGRRLIALRSNERAAASLGLQSSMLKAYAFILGAGVAGVGGVLYAFAQPTVVFNGTTDNFSVFASILIIAMTVAGGVGSVGGALLGSLLLAGGIVSQALSGWHSIDDYLPLIGGIGLVLVLMQGPDGLFEFNRLLLVRTGSKLARFVPRVSLPSLPRRTHDPLRSQAAAVAVTPATLTVRGLSVSFGGIKALQGVDLVIEPGKIHGLIGPNGAGKTTLIDAVTGFVKSSGSVMLGSVDLSNQSARARARLGISRSFQSLELFNDLTILENLVVACERHRPFRYVSDLFLPGRAKLSAAAIEAVKQFELADIIDKRPDAISFGQRKTVAIARAIAAAPPILLLDEPAAGLNDHEAAELARLIRMVADDWNIGVLLVEHKVDLVTSISDTITVLESGRVLAAGTPREVVASQAVIDAYLGSSAPIEASTDDIAEGVGSVV